MFEGERDDVTRQALAVARNGVDGTRGQFAEHRDAFDELGQFLEMVVERAVEFGAMGERDDLAGFAGVEVAEVVQLADVVVALAGDGGLGDGEELVGGLAHRGDDYDGMEIGAGFDDGCDALDGGGGFDGRTAEFHYDHQSSSPSECISSALRTAAPAAPRIVL